MTRRVPATPNLHHDGPRGRIIVPTGPWLRGPAGEGQATVITRIVHNTNLERFEIYVREEVAAYADYVDIGDVRNFDHTVTKQRFEGHGLASELINHALAQTREQGLKIVTSCSFVRAYIQSHPEYRDLVA